MKTVFREQLGVHYERALVPVAAGAEAVTDAATGQVLPVQVVPALPFDDGAEGEVALALVDVEPGRELELVAAAHAASADPRPIRVEQDAGGTSIINGRRAIRLPADGLFAPPYPGPVAAMRIDGGEWFGRSRLVDAPWPGTVHVQIESLGPCCVQWQVRYRWGAGAGLTVRARWAAGADTILAVEDADEDTDAAVEWLPLGDRPAKAYKRGGGEGLGPMAPLEYRDPALAAGSKGRRLLDRLSHVSYFNQWNLAWVGFGDGGDRFVGLFSARGGLWRRRGHVRIEIHEDHERGCLVRMPVRRGRRIYGLVLTTPAESDFDRDDRRTLLNRRKVEWSDLAISKVRSWVLDGPLEPAAPRLVRAADLADFRDRLAGDPQVPAAIERFRRHAAPGAPGQFAAALWARDDEAMRDAGRRLAEAARTYLADYADGGYERVIIFDGRRAKSDAYDLDLLWALGRIDEDDYRTVRRWLLVLAYVFADPDYCTYGDFWPRAEPDEGIAEALADDMGDCPVPPNFASEFFSTTGLVAEMVDWHPMRDAWRHWAMAITDRFNETFFEPDGTYHESLNYHSHALNELLCYYWPLRIRGVRDYFAEPRVIGSFRHFVEVLMPPLEAGQIAPAAADRLPVRADPSAPTRCAMPCDGNTGSEGLESELRAETIVGQAVYRDREPALAAQLACAWRGDGKLVLDGVHPVLSMLLLDPSAEAAEPLVAGAWRRSLGVFSRATAADGGTLWCEFRAGCATHHMDFDQGNVRLAAWGRVLLGDYSYHCHEADGSALPVYSTWMHNTIVYSDDKTRSSGYTGLEQAPRPARVHLGDAFDWCVHRIVNTNWRGTVDYRLMVPAPETVHLRHYLLVKPDYVLLWDVFERAETPSTFWLHPPSAVEPVGAGRFRAGQPGQPHLVVQFVMPTEPEVVENCRVGPHWSFGVRNDVGRPYLTLLVPQKTDRGVTASFDAETRTVTVAGDGIADTIILPPPGATEGLPTIQRHV